MLIYKKKGPKKKKNSSILFQNLWNYADSFEIAEELHAFCSAWICFFFKVYKDFKGINTFISLLFDSIFQMNQSMGGWTVLSKAKLERMYQFFKKTINSNINKSFRNKKNYKKKNKKIWREKIRLVWALWFRVFYLLV